MCHYNNTTGCSFSHRSYDDVIISLLFALLCYAIMEKILRSFELTSDQMGNRGERRRKTEDDTSVEEED